MVTTKVVTKKAPFSRRVVDHVTDELVNVLSTGETFEFKALFSKVFEGLKLKNAVSGGEEMLRLRSYEKILKLTNCGLVNVLSTGETFEFKALFSKVFEGLKLKNAVSGGEEMLRLRSYEKILKLTNCGLVKKVGKTYRALEGIESASSAHRLARLDSAILAAAQAKA